MKDSRRHPFHAQGNQEFINAVESADFAVLVNVHPGVAEAQGELGPFGFRLLQAAPNRFEILAGLGDGFLDAPGTGLVVVVGITLTSNCQSRGWL